MRSSACHSPVPGSGAVWTSISGARPTSIPGAPPPIASSVTSSTGSVARRATTWTGSGSPSHTIAVR